MVSRQNTETLQAPSGQRRWISSVRVSVYLLVVGWLLAWALVADFKQEPYDTTLDVSYAEGARRKLDVYRTRGAKGAPVVVFFYGGRWEYGAKEWYRFVAATLASRGYVVVVPDYRLYPEVKFPEFVVDGAEAVRWTHENISAYGGDPRRVFVMGHSAGAYIAAMLALDPQWLAGVGLNANRDIAGLVGVSGPYDFSPLEDATLADIFGGAVLPTTQPISFTQGRKPPALLLTGAADDVVDPANSARLAEKLRSSGNEATDVIYRRQGHMTVLAGFVPMLANFFPTLRDVNAFIERVKPAPPEDVSAFGGPAAPKTDARPISK
jgi:acetyl esterase/lipase